MDEQLFEHLRDALNNLYDAEHLRANPLAKVFGLAGRADTPVAMQKALEQLIQALKPRQDDPGRSQKRRMYDLLYSRYIDQFSQREVANQLGISLRSYQREQKLALEFLAGVLAEKYPINQAAVEVSNPTAPEGRAAEDAGGGAGTELDDEFAWMFSPSAPRGAALNETIAMACQLAQPLTTQYNASVVPVLAQDSPQIAIHSQALLQIVLNSLIPAIHLAAGDKVLLHVSLQPRQVLITFDGKNVLHRQAGAGVPAAQTSPELSDADHASLVVARRLAEKAGGSFVARLDTPNFAISVRLPTLETVSVLVIDDSTDNIKLMQRYLAGTRYQMSSLNQPELAIEFVEQAHPQIVVLDLMMPGVDGLEILTHLHSNPMTVNIPVVVCTILPQQELALALGASAFLRKPISRESLLETLEHLCATQALDFD